MPKVPPGKQIPFSFVLEQLHSIDPLVKPMFGCWAIYVRDKIVLILRQRKDHPKANGVWLATSKGDHESLRREFPSMRSITLLGKGVTNWQVIPEAAKDFESSVLDACELILKNDPRIGRIPSPRRPPKKKAQRT